MIGQKQRVVMWATDPIPAFLKYLEAKRQSPKTIRNHRLDLYKIQRDLGYPVYLASPDALAEYIGTLGYLKAATVQHKIYCLHVFFRWALRHGVVTSDPSADLEPPKGPARLPVHLEPDEVKAMMGALSEDNPIALREAAMMKALYYTGIRSGELVGLDISSWLTTQGYLRVIGKGDKERLVPVPKALAKVLEKWVAIHPLGTGPMFTSLGADPGRLSYDRVRGIFNQVMRRAGLEDRGFHPHSLRHTYGTRLRRKGVDLDKIRDLLGHRSVSTTEIYTHTMIDGDTIAALDRIL